MAEDTLGELIAGLVKAVHVELPDEAVHLAVPEQPREHNLLKFVDVLYDKLAAGGSPEYYLAEFVALNECRHLR